MKIEILGSGCKTCHAMYELTQKAVKELQIKEEVNYVTGPDGANRILELGLMSSPILLIDDQVVIAKAVTSLDFMKSLIQKHIG
jgi:small redox-active disulfide protein 2